MKVNRALLWDMDWKPEEYATERFRRWYSARVLSNGNAEDIRGLEEAFDDIPRCLEGPGIPRSVRQYWKWYFEVFGEHAASPHAGPAGTARPA
ncbi:MAG: hypothetical protein AAB368_14360 [bacterium]